MQFPQHITLPQASSLSSFWGGCPFPNMSQGLEELRCALLLPHPSVLDLQVILAHGTGLWPKVPSTWQCVRRRSNLVLPLKSGRFPVPCRCLQRDHSFRGRRTDLESSMGGLGRIFQIRLLLHARTLCYCVLNTVKSWRNHLLPCCHLHFCVRCVVYARSW